MYIIKFISAGWQNWKMNKILKKACQDDEIIAKLSYTFGTQFKVDWIGRIYAVVNPVIKDGKYSPEQIMEYTDNGINIDEFIKGWVMERLIAMDSFLKSNNLFDMLTYKLDKLDEHGNYLFKLYPVTLETVLNRAPAAKWELVGLSAGAISLIIWSNWGNIVSWFA